VIRKINFTFLEISDAKRKSMEIGGIFFPPYLTEREDRFCPYLLKVGECGDGKDWLMCESTTQVRQSVRKARIPLEVDVHAQFLNTYFFLPKMNPEMEFPLQGFCGTIKGISLPRISI
jgi:hypothetical protein